MSLDRTDPCAELQPQIAAYALGEAEAADELLEHLAHCPACQRDLRAYVQVARMLPYEAPDAAPPASLRARILTAVGDAAAAAPAPTLPSTPQPSAQAPERVTEPPRRRRWGLPSFSPAFGLALAAIVVLLAWNISLQRRLSTQSAQITANRASWQSMIVLLNDPTVRWYDLAGGTAKGHFWAAPQGKVACLVIQGLPALPSDKVYQVWLVERGEHTSGGVFEAREGNGWVLVRSNEPLADYDVVGVTIEPRGGSDGPTSPPVLQGQIAEAHMPSVADRQQQLQVIARLRD
jgi:Anti-sigma-K factor rskA